MASYVQLKKGRKHKQQGVKLNKAYRKQIQQDKTGKTQHGNMHNIFYDMV